MMSRSGVIRPDWMGPCRVLEGWGCLEFDGVSSEVPPGAGLITSVKTSDTQQVFTSSV